jgi:hypothetical protein
MSTRRLTVLETKALKSGTGANGKPWTIYDVTAVGEDGAPIEEKLRSFDELHGTVEVEIERVEHEKYGVSYTLKLPRGAPGAAPAPAAGARLGPPDDELRNRVAALEQIVTTLVERFNESSGASTTPVPAPAKPQATF